MTRQHGRDERNESRGLHQTEYFAPFAGRSFVTHGSEDVDKVAWLKFRASTVPPPP